MFCFINIIKENIQIFNELISILAARRFLVRINEKPGYLKRGIALYLTKQIKHTFSKFDFIFYELYKYTQVHYKIEN